MPTSERWNGQGLNLHLRTKTESTFAVFPYTTVPDMRSNNENRL